MFMWRSLDVRLHYSNTVQILTDMVSGLGACEICISSYTGNIATINGHISGEKANMAPRNANTSNYSAHMATVKCQISDYKANAD